jgi:hypothetical protein
MDDTRARRKSGEKRVSGEENDKDKRIHPTQNRLKGIESGKR